ncbi:MAG: GIY-YIG nuclease family protein [Chloroflexia bacterium]|nr:GIY-YIG nuclease family protein [Chloroflexia bacterium]
MNPSLPAQPGTYVLVLHLPRPHTIAVGRLGEITFAEGYYLYVGSARGPGGLRARLRRHLRREKRLHWHVDYLRRWARPVEIYFAVGDGPGECHWRGLLQESGLSLPVPGFGASDCRCPSHLLYSPDRPADLRPALRAGGGSVPRRIVVPHK